MSKEGRMKKSPFRELVQAVGMNETAVRNELQPLLNRKGGLEDEMTLEDLRQIVAEYLQDTFINLKDELSA